ncbi:ribonuclease H-like domain, reverse transcriptase, RNA-dependent DNA polymerase [Tanacetum coccineum]
MVGDNEQYLGTVHWREKGVYVCLLEGAGERWNGLLPETKEAVLKALETFGTSHILEFNYLLGGNRARLFAIVLNVCYPNKIEEKIWKEFEEIDKENLFSADGNFSVKAFNEACEMKGEHNNLHDFELMECNYIKTTISYYFYMVIEAVEEEKLGIYEARVICNRFGGEMILCQFVLTDRKPFGTKRSNNNVRKSTLYAAIYCTKCAKETWEKHEWKTLRSIYCVFVAINATAGLEQERIHIERCCGEVEKRIRDKQEVERSGFGVEECRDDTREQQQQQESETKEEGRLDFGAQGEEKKATYGSLKTQRHLRKDIKLRNVRSQSRKPGELTIRTCANTREGPVTQEDLNQIRIGLWPMETEIGINQQDMCIIGLLAYYLGIEVTQTGGEITIKQTGYINKILKETSMTDSNDTKIPMDPGTYYIQTRSFRYSVGLSADSCKTRKSITEGSKHCNPILCNGTKEAWILIYKKERAAARLQNHYCWCTQKQPTVGCYHHRESEFLGGYGAACQAFWLKRLLNLYLEKLTRLEALCKSLGGDELCKAEVYKALLKRHHTEAMEDAWSHPDKDNTGMISRAMDTTCSGYDLYNLH